MKAFPLLFVVLALLTSCTPLRVVRVSPERETDVARYDYGAAILEATAGEATASVSYYDATPEFLVFNVEITNNGKTAFDFDPATISLTTDQADVVPAIDPELYLLDQDITSVRRQRNARTWGWIGAGVLIASSAYLAIDAATDEAVDNVLLAESVANTAVDLAFLANANENTRLQQAYAAPGQLPTPNQRQFWLDYALRLTTVPPGGTAVGKLVFPRQDLAQSMAIAISLPDGIVKFDFLQMVMRP